MVATAFRAADAAWRAVSRAVWGTDPGTLLLDQAGWLEVVSYGFLIYAGGNVLTKLATKLDIRIGAPPAPSKEG